MVCPYTWSVMKKKGRPWNPDGSRACPVRKRNVCSVSLFAAKVVQRIGFPLDILADVGIYVCSG